MMIKWSTVMICLALSAILSTSLPGADEAVTKATDPSPVYVREAHPTDGWKMGSNEIVGVSVAQPKTYAERTAVASQCHRLLKPAILLLVDEINDPTGNAYSGMPARLYVIDTSGRVAYKSGRGPFGFKTGEMEQTLLMTLMDEKGLHHAGKSTSATN